jgi:hypothetical protein
MKSNRQLPPEGKVLSSIKDSIICILVLTLIMIANTATGGEIKLGFQGNVDTDTLWIQDWESGWNDWYADNGVWEVGDPGPDYGPDTAYSGVNCAGTVLNGQYPTNTSSRLISPAFVVPPADQNPRVKFFMWHKLYSDSDRYYDDYGYIQVKFNHPDSSWHDIRQIHGYNPRWCQSIGDLIPYAGLEVRIGFRIVSDESRVSDGWYLDNVLLATGDYDFVAGDFEDGWGDWYADNGVWEVGEPGPDYGPDSVYTGLNCAGTILNGNYTDYTSSRLVSPPFMVPSADQKPRIKFFMWHKLHSDSDRYYDDYGYIQVKFNHPDSSWHDIGQIHGYSPRWCQSIGDLIPYAGLEVRIGFRIVSDESRVSDGWYLDNVLLTTGDYDFAAGDFEDGWGDWYTDNGVWEVGEPGPDYGPDSAYSGNNCAGTILNGNYTDYTSSRLISPPFEVRQGNPMLFLESWHQLYTDSYHYYDDFGYIQAKINHPDSSWISVDTISGYNPVWSHMGIDLSRWVGLEVRIAMLIVSDESRNDDGWYVDAIDLPMRPPGYFELVYNPDDFIFAIPEDSIVSRTFQLISNNATGYVNSLCNADWVYITPDSVNLSPNDTSIVTVYFNSEGLAYTTHHTNIRFESNVEGLENEVIPVEMTVFTPLNVNVDIADSILHVGDVLSVSITIDNPTGSMVDAWMATGMELPNGSIYGPVFGPWNFGMLPHGTLSGRLDHVVPGIAPIGDYRYIVKASSSRRFDFILGEGDHGFEIVPPGGAGGNGIITQRSDPGQWVTVFSEFTGYTDPVSKTDTENIPTSSALLQNYPNPFNAATEISFALANSGNVGLKIYNLTGQLIETLIDNHVEAGMHTVTWNASAYSSGIYFYKLTARDKVFTRRMTLLK